MALCVHWAQPGMPGLPGTATFYERYCHFFQIPSNTQYIAAQFSMRRGRDLIMKLQHTSPQYFTTTSTRLHCSNGRLQLRQRGDRDCLRRSSSGNLKTTAGEKRTLKTKHCTQNQKTPEETEASGQTTANIINSPAPGQTDSSH